MLFNVFILPSYNALAADIRSAANRGPAGIIGPNDDRGPIPVQGPKVGLTPAEINQIRNALGYLVCPSNDTSAKLGTDGKRKPVYFTSTAFLIGKSTVVTVAHQFIGPNGAKRTENGSFDSCYFHTQGDVEKVYKIKPDTMVLGSQDPVGDEKNDWAIVNLQTPVESGQPLTILDSPELRSDQQIWPVVAFRAKHYQKKDAPDSTREPLVQTCIVRRRFTGVPGVRPSRFFSDCDNTAGGSGGPIMSRVGGRLVVMGILVGMGKAKDGSNYSDLWRTFTANNQNYNGEPFFYRTPAMPCTDGKPRSTIIYAHETYTLMRDECRDLEPAAQTVIEWNQITRAAPSAPELKFKNHTYQFEGVLTAEYDLALALGLHIDSTFLASVEDVLKRTYAIGYPAGAPPVGVQPQAAEPSPAATTRPMRQVPRVKRPAQNTGSSGFLWNN